MTSPHEHVEEFKILGHIIEVQGSLKPRYRGRLVLADADGFHRVVLAVAPGWSTSLEGAVEGAVREWARTAGVR